MKRAAFVLLCLAVSAPAFAQRSRAVAPGAPPPAIGEAFAGLSANDRALFAAGKREFRFLFEVQDGLGPMLNGRACQICHNDPADGGTSFRMVARVGKMVGGTFDPLTELGGSLLQKGMGSYEGSSHEFPSETAPKDAIVAQRRTQPLFGLGLVDATPDSTFIALAQSQAFGPTPGRAAMVDNLVTGTKTVGKFGWKSQIATLEEFSGAALLDEIGITSPRFPDEACPAGKCSELAFNPRPDLNDDGTRVRLLTTYMQLLAPPTRGPITAAVRAGEQVFNQIGCNSCHVATLVTGPNTMAALDRATYHPYSDFLLHDMGTLGDSIEQGNARGGEMRTQPLWGLHVLFQPSTFFNPLPPQFFLHDRRAPNLDAAISGHAGQASLSRQRFLQLNETDHASLMAFLNSL